MFDSVYEQLIATRSYARWNQELGRRETWYEGVLRYKNFLLERFENHPRYPEIEELIDRACSFIYNLDIVPSMRCFWTAGEALKIENLAGYNCVGTIVEHPRVFSEILYMSMCGCGVSFSVERQFVNRLPDLPSKLLHRDKVIEVADSKLGWAVAVKKLINDLYRGDIPRFDLSKVRPEGAVLKTFGGRAGGPELLAILRENLIRIFMDAQGSKLSSLDCHDIICHIGDAVISGGTRRTAFGSLSNLSDGRMATAKSGDFSRIAPQRAYANNSVAYTEKPDAQKFLSEWLKLVQSKTGERGIFNREAAVKQVMKGGRRDPNQLFVTNPCGETILRKYGLCNLTEVIIRPYDTSANILEKVWAATVLGVLQSTLTDFRFVNHEFKKNAEEERLIGVSMTGTRDHFVLRDICKETIDWLESFKRRAIKTAQEVSEILGINMPAACTLCKPSGTVSQIAGTASGIHPRYSKYYLRRVRISRTDPLVKLLEHSGVPWEPENGYRRDNAPTVVFTFPIRSPDASIVTPQCSASNQLEYWKMFKDNWCEHTASITIHVDDSEWMEVGAWVFKNWNDVVGLTFLPRDTGLHKLPPFEKITAAEYKAYPKYEIDFSKLAEFEKDDWTEGSREYACTTGGCEI